MKRCPAKVLVIAGLVHWAAMEEEAWAASQAVEVTTEASA